MAKTNAEKQAAYRARHLKQEDADSARLQLVVRKHIKAMLTELADHNGKSVKDTIELLIEAAHSSSIGKKG